ncbi:hypothetical protein LguiA_004605 [Lonicera macranthoides]
MHSRHASRREVNKALRGPSEISQVQGEIPVEIGNLKLLERLIIQNSSLEGSIPNSIFNMSSLEIIDLRENNLTGSLPMDIHYNLPILQELYLDKNQHTGQIPSSLWECRGLQLLLLADNKLTRSMSENIGNLTSLKNLHLSDNNLTGTLPNELGNLDLQILFLDGNKLSGRIPFEIFNISTIIDIALSMNQFSSPLPSSMGLWIPNLQRLYLGRNRLSGSFPNSISNAFKLTMIEMSSNSFTGFIPSTLGNLRDLEWLMIGENNLTGKVSTPELRFFNSLTNCKNLKMLSISLNQFNGILPSSIANLSTSLRMFEAFGCKIKGEIPIGIGNLSSLTNLVLDSNELTGFVPSTIERLENLELLYLEHNNLQGSIPNDRCLLERMGDLYLSHNKLNGPIPSCLGVIPCTIANGQMLTFLSLAHNKLQGSIPQSLGNLRKQSTWSGGVGSVYKGILSDEVNVAVKVFNLQLDEAFKSFDVECGVLHNIRHHNLTKIVSSCSNPDFIALVLEYMPNGSLEKWLYSHNYCLTILEWLNIMIDAASALEYLHHGQTTPILHCDLKPSNVLLDKDMIAHVYDFGIAKLLGEDEFMAQTKTLATIGYMAPEYGREGIVSTKGDVYSYGILLMETFTRKKPTDEMFSNILTMRSWVYEASLGPIAQVVVPT